MGNCALKLQRDEEEYTHRTTEARNFAPKPFDNVSSEDAYLQHIAMKHKSDVIFDNTMIQTSIADHHSTSTSNRAIIQEIREDSLQASITPLPLQEQTTFTLAEDFLDDYMLSESGEEPNHADDIHLPVTHLEPHVSNISLQQSVASLDPLCEKGIIDEVAALITDDEENEKY
eukprot:431158_1